MFKKTALILASALIMMSFAACGGNDNDSSEPYQSKNQDSKSYSDNSGKNNNDGIMDDTINGIENDVRDGIDNVEEGIRNGMDSVNPSNNAR